METFWAQLLVHLSLLLVTLVELVLVLVLATAMITKLLLVLVLATAMITHLLFMFIVGKGFWSRGCAWCCHVASSQSFVACVGEGPGLIVTIVTITTMLG